MTTSHIYGCEHKGCPNIGQPVRQWIPGWGYFQVHLCPEHAQEIT